MRTAVTSRLFRRIVVMTGLILSCVAVSAQQNWPDVRLPKSVTPFPIGDQMTINGLPMKLQGFLSESSPAELTEQFRKTLGKPLVENTIGGKQLLGRAMDTYYLTVQIEPAGRGSKGVVAVSDLKSMHEHRNEFQSTNARWLNRLPAGSRIESQLTSEDSGKTASHMVIVNGHSERLNRDALESMLREDGFRLEREATPNEKTLAAFPAGLPEGRTLFFKGSGKEAMAVITSDQRGRTSVVLNTVTILERLK